MAQPIQVDDTGYTYYADLKADQRFEGTNKFGSSSNYIEMDESGHLVLSGSAIVSEDFQVPLANIKAPASDPPTWTTYKGCELPLFGAGGTNIVYFTAQLQHSWAEGSTIEPHIHLAYTNANAGNSVWRFTYSWANMGEDFPAATTINVTTAAPSVTDRHVYCSFSGVTGTNKTASSVMLCSIARIGGDNADTYGSGIFAVSADIHISKNRLGSY